MEAPKNRQSNWSVFGALGAAIGASACCTVPLILVTLGAGGAWMSYLTALEPYRPLFIGGAVGLLGFAVGHRIYQFRTTPDCACETGMASRSKNLLLGSGVVLTLALIVSPWLLPRAMHIHATTATPAAETTYEIILDIAGMSCASCTTTVSLALERTDGVLEAQVTYSPPRAVVKYDPALINVETLTSIVSNTGYHATPASSITMISDSDPMSPLSLETLRHTFNAHQDDVRVLAILSATCGECIAGHEVMRQVFGQLEDDRLTGLIVWLPMLAGDDSGAATIRAGTFVDNRLRLQGWDSDREIGSAFEKTLELTRTAWDVYMVYDAGITWEDALPPRPSYWMHQLTEVSGADQRFCLNPGTLAREVAQGLKRTTPTP